MAGGQEKRGRSTRRCIICDKAVRRNAALSERVTDDRKYCGSCVRELLSWMRGYELARSFGGYYWIDSETARCYLCGEDATEDNPLNTEHVVPKSAGGRDLVINYGLACQSCNSSKGGRLVELTTDQAARLAKQQEAFRNRYEQMKPHIEDGFKQEVIVGFAGDADADPEYDLTADELGSFVVGTLEDALRRYDNEDYPEERLPVDFEERALAWADLVFEELGRREWFQAVPDNEMNAAVGLAIGEIGLDPRGLLPEDYRPRPEETGLGELLSDEGPETEGPELGSVRLADGGVLILALEEGEVEPGDREVEVEPGVTKRLADCTIQEVERAQELADE